MSVDFYACDCCGDSRYSECVGYCSKCSHSLCTSCLINNDINSNYAYEYGVKFDGSKEQKEMYDVKSKEESKYGYEIGNIIDDAGIDEKYCPFCNGDKIHNDDLLEFALKKLNITQEQLKEEFLKQN